MVGVSKDSLEKPRALRGQAQPAVRSSSATRTARCRSAYDVKKSLGILPGRVTYVIDPEGIVRKVFSSQLRATQHKAEALATIRGD